MMTPQQLKRNNIILLVCLVISIAVFPVFQSPRIVFKHAILAAIVLSSMFCLNFRPRTQRILSTAGVLVIFLLLLSNFVDSDVLNLLDYLATFGFLLLIVVFIIGHIARKKEVDATIIISSVNGFLLLGVLWSLLLNSAYFLESTVLGHEQVIAFPVDQPDYHDFTYFSFVTLTTLGYGDVTPVSPLARSLAMLIAISGQFYMTLLVALLVGKYLGSQKGD